MPLRFIGLVLAVSALSFATAWSLSGMLGASGTVSKENTSPPALRSQQALDEPSLWRIRARRAYAPPAPIGGRPETVPGRLLQQACKGLSARSWQVPRGATRAELCACVGRMMDRTPQAEGLADLTDHLFATQQPPHPGSSAMATGLITARITCQRGLFAALHADG